MFFCGFQRIFSCTAAAGIEDGVVENKRFDTVYQESGYDFSDIVRWQETCITPFPPVKLDGDRITLSIGTFKLFQERTERNKVIFHVSAGLLKDDVLHNN